MKGDKVLETLSAPEEKSKNASIDASILAFVKDIKIAYPSEIVGELGFSRQTVFDHIRHLKTTGKLERVYLTRFVPEILKKRLDELWNMGLKGAMIRRMSWYAIPGTVEVEK